MSHSWKTSPVTVVFIALGTILVALGVFGYMHARNQKQYLLSAVTHQIEAHSSAIAALLSEARGKSSSQIEDAIYEELQRVPSTSLIKRSMISVRSSSGSLWECVIDLTSLGLRARQIKEASDSTEQTAPTHPFSSTSNAAAILAPATLSVNRPPAIDQFRQVEPAPLDVPSLTNSANISILIQDLHSLAPAVRKQSAARLGTLGFAASEALPLLRELSKNDPDPSVRSTAGEAVLNIRGYSPPEQDMLPRK